MFVNEYFDLEEYFKNTEDTFTPINSNGNSGFTYTDKKDGHTYTYLEEDEGGFTRSGGPTSCYYDKFGNS